MLRSPVVLTNRNTGMLSLGWSMSSCGAEVVIVFLAGECRWVERLGAFKDQAKIIILSIKNYDKADFKKMYFILMLLKSVTSIILV